MTKGVLKKESLVTRIIKKTLMWIILLWFAFFTLMPLVYLIISSLKTNTELVGSSPFSLPDTLQFSNYIEAWTVSGIGKMMINSIVVSLCATGLNAFFASMASFALSRFDYKGREVIFSTIIAGVLIPINAFMIPYSILIKNIGLYDTRLGLIVTYTAIGIPISTFIVRGFMKSLPKELEEAAIIDGCNFYQRFFNIILPISRTGIITAATFQFLLCWNEFIYAMLLTSKPQIRMVQLGIKYFQGQFTTDYTSMYAAIVISIIPSILGYIIFQEQIVSGLTQGAVKG